MITALRRAVIVLIAVVVCALAVPATPAKAFDPFSGEACNSNSAIPCNTPSSDPLGGPNGLFMKITNIIAYVAGALAIIIILAGAFRLITSGSDVSTGSRTDTDVEDARRSIAGALIGLAIIVLAKVIITYVVKRF